MRQGIEGPAVPFPVRRSWDHAAFQPQKKNWREARGKRNPAYPRQRANAMTRAKPLAYVVDDEETIAKTLALILNSSGFEAVAFSKPMEALRAAEKRSPDYLITDVSMPLLNGIELGIQFKAIHPECRVLLFSGAISTGPLLKGAAQKGYEFTILAKPVHPTELLDVLNRMGARKPIG
jgi:FixJ family two-component response regulator